jgi:(5-formylfuran-3-yl)methyl phosphate synthase
MPGLLVSVRSASEARAALAGGADIIDVKEPGRGPLGMADPEVWHAVRRAVPKPVPVSVALGELADWDGRNPSRLSRIDGVAFRKLGLAGEARGPAAAWQQRFSTLQRAWGEGPAWVAVAYADWEHAEAPHPDAVLAFALRGACAGVLVDSHEKKSPSTLGPHWKSWIARARRGGLLVALAGGLDAAAIARLVGLAPDWFAVRGAACGGGDRGASVEPERVEALARAVRAQGAIRSRVVSGRTCRPSLLLPCPSETESLGGASGFTERCIPRPPLSSARPDSLLGE